MPTKLPNEVKVLAAARAYKIAARAYGYADRHYGNKASVISDAAFRKAMLDRETKYSAMNDAKDRLLYLIETGASSYPKRK